jgi:hypothetical protein
MSRRKKLVRFPSPSAFEDAWLRQATTEAIRAARNVVSGGAVPPMTPVGRLSDTEWGWIVASILFGWLRERATQATANGLNVEKQLQQTGIIPDPWLLGCIACALPELAETQVDWNAPLGELSRDELLAFLGDAYALIQKAVHARDLGEHQITRQPPTRPTTEDIPWNDPIPALDRELKPNS